MAYPPNPNPTPTPTPRPVSSGYISPADYMASYCDALEQEDQADSIKVGAILEEMRRIRDLFYNAET